MSDDKNENGQTWSGFFTAFRDEGGPTLYGHNRTPVTVDVLEIGFIFAAAILTLSFLLILPAYRGGGGVSINSLKTSMICALDASELRFYLVSLTETFFCNFRSRLHC